MSAEQLWRLRELVNSVLVRKIAAEKAQLDRRLKELGARPSTPAKKMSNARAIGGGVMMGFGIAPLHYLDMLAMRMRADCHFNFMLVALSVVFAIAFSYSALRIAFYFRDATAEAMRKIGSAFFMASATAGPGSTTASARRSQPPSPPGRRATPLPPWLRVH